MTGQQLLSPLHEIETIVQARAKEEAIDLGAEASVAALAQLVEDEIGRWNIDHQRGIRAFALHDPGIPQSRPPMRWKVYWVSRY